MFAFTTVVNSVVVLEILNVHCGDSSLRIIFKTAGSNYPAIKMPAAFVCRRKYYNFVQYVFEQVGSAFL